MQIKRNFSLNANRNATIATISFLGIIPIVFLLLNTIDRGNFAEKSVSKSLFGNYFVMAHLILLFLLTGIIGAGTILYKKGIIQHFTPRLIKLEQKKFKQKYNIEIEKTVSKRQMVLYRFTMVLSTTFPLITVLILSQVFKIENYNLALMIGVVLMFIGFYTPVKYELKKNATRTKNIFSLVNKKFKKTNLKLTDNDLQYNLGSVGVNLDINGMYEGFDVIIKSRSGGYKTGRKVKTYSSVKVEVQVDTDLNFKMTERRPKWRKYEGDTLDECFNTRFNLSNIKVSDLPQEFKKSTVNYQRNLFLEFNEKKLTYSIKNSEILPFYTIEGMILFLDNMIEIVELLNEQDKKIS